MNRKELLDGVYGDTRMVANAAVDELFQRIKRLGFVPPDVSEHEIFGALAREALELVGHSRLSIGVGCRLESITIFNDEGENVIDRVIGRAAAKLTREREKRNSGYYA